MASSERLKDLQHLASILEHHDDNDHLPNKKQTDACLPSCIRLEKMIKDMIREEKRKLSPISFVPSGLTDCGLS